MTEPFVRLDTTELDRLVRDADPQAEQVLKAVAFDIEAQAKLKAPVLTGFLKSSIKAEEMTGLVWRINVWAHYGIFVELGTSKMRSQPFLIPAVERAMDVWIEAYKRYFT